MPNLTNSRIVAQVDREIDELFLSDTAYVTIYNRYTVSRSDTYQRSVVEQVKWTDARAANRMAAGDIANDKAVISVLSDANYLAPIAWQALVTKTGKWTLQVGDYIVYGTVTDTITALFTISDLKAKYDNVLRITSVDTKEIGSVGLGYWEVSAK